MERGGGPIPLWLQAGLWELVAGSALVLGAAIGYFTPLTHRIIASVMGFGGGVLIAVLSFELVEEAYVQAGFVPTTLGFAAGAISYSRGKIHIDDREIIEHQSCECYEVMRRAFNYFRDSEWQGESEGQTSYFVVRDELRNIR